METIPLRQTRKINSAIIGLLIFGALGTAIVFYWRTQETLPQPDLTSQTVMVKNQDWVLQIQANGVVQAVRKINLSPEDSGRISKLYVNEGDRIHKGQIIARMSSERFQAQVDQYQALLQKAIAELEQKRRGTREEEIAESIARVATAEASIAAAEARLNRANEEVERHQSLVEAGAISQNAFEEFFAKQQEAQANLAAELARHKEQQESLIRAKNGLRPEEISQAEAEVAQAKAQLAFYQSQLENTVIRAPFDGIITRRFAQEGDFVTPTTSASASEGATSTSIAELSHGLEIEGRIPEANISRIHIGQIVDIKTDTYPDETFQGRVSLIAPRAVQENNVTSFRVRVALTTGQTQLKSGMNVRLTFLSQPIPNAVVIPLAAVVTQPDGKTGVYVVDEQNQTRFQIIQVSAASGDQVQVLSGLQIGDRVLITPPTNLKIDGVDNLNVTL